MGSVDVLPFWQVNCSPQDRTLDCPPFLRGLSEKDQRIIGTPDAAFRVLTWEEVGTIVRENRLEMFQRIPSQLRRYRAFTYRLAEHYGSVASFVLQVRLGWESPVKARGAPFQYADDVRILWNDWPYGLDDRIVHLVVWTKFELKANTTNGDLTKMVRDEIENFVTKTFRSRVPSNNVLWFKNWASLKSIHAVEHFHVLMFDPDVEFVRQVTNGDVPQCAKEEL
ncbi:uncharacterized protein UV8b_02151 [Ustilaginoidea virens]|uniref:N-acetylglucosamine-induced protein 1 n=1 Tax=Ustilaginoidea virens TaxID=1159556 RepID=A0A8E5HMD4_USTVR|nr:uncharacterized protein UV8b_02151 [Ustilaginoidea virens]QUC17910.1 hypothetical protein UV8b_02151 [Ustilaginoidea virens]